MTSQISFVSTCLSLLLYLSSCEATTGRFSKVGVSFSSLSASGSLSESSTVAPNVPPVMGCSLLCLLRPWCQLWWMESSPDLLCYFSDVIVLPWFDDSSADAIDVYTRRPKGIILSEASIYTNALTRIIAPTRVKENLVDGFYSRTDIGECYWTEERDNPYIMIFLSVPQVFSKVLIHTIPFGNANSLAKTQHLEVAYDGIPLGTFAAGTQFDQELVVESPTPLTAQIITITMQTALDNFQICHLEIY